MTSPSATLHARIPAHEHASAPVKVAALFPPGVGLRILDVGCGDGRLSRVYLAEGHAVSGLDANAEAVAAACAAGIAAQIADIEAPWPVADASFDVVLLLDALEHTVDHAAVLREARRVLRPSGSLLLAYPNHFDVRNRVEMLAGRGMVHWSHRRYGVAPWEYGHVRFLRRIDLLGLLAHSGFAVTGEQRNFMGGGLVPRRLLPFFICRALLRRFPEAFSGKFVFRAAAFGSTSTLELVLLDRTPSGL